jgi:ribosomal protein L32
MRRAGNFEASMEELEFCPKCYLQIPAHAEICPHCGTLLSDWEKKTYSQRLSDALEARSPTCECAPSSRLG